MTTADLVPNNRIEIVVVPLDGSEFAVRALHAGTRLARRLDAAMLLCSAVAKEQEVDERTSKLRELRPRGVTADVDVLIDPDPADAIDVVLRDLGDAGVACLASHGRGRSAAIVGSVATEVLRRSRRPLVVVGPGYDEVRIDARAGTGVVVCVGDEQTASQLLPSAVRWSQLLRERLTILTVAEDVPPPIGNGPARRAFGPDGDVEAFLARVVAPYRARVPDIDARVVYDPVSPVAGVRDYLFARPAALVAIGSRGRTGLTRAIFGSVATDIVRESTVPVLVVPRVDGHEPAGGPKG
jgi:nucleotide-binding universal stress UspA family protein